MITYVVLERTPAHGSASTVQSESEELARITAKTLEDAAEQLPDRMGRFVLVPEKHWHEFKRRSSTVWETERVQDKSEPAEPSG